MILDYKRPKFNHMIDFMLKQQRFALLQENNPQEAHKLFQKQLMMQRTAISSMLT